MALDFRVAELGLGLSLELRLQQLDADHRGQTLADVLTAEVGIRLLEQSRLARVAVERVGQRRSKAGHVAAALGRVDVVGEGEDRLDEGVVVLERDLDLRGLDLAIHVEGHLVHDALARVEVTYE